MQPTQKAARLISSVCAGHGARLPGWKSPDQVYVEPTCLRAARRQEGRRRARASSRGGVWRKPNPKMRGDLSAPVCVVRTGRCNAQAGEQEPDRRCGTPGASWHLSACGAAQAGVTAKPSLHAGVCFINPAFTHRRSWVLPREVCTVSTGRVD